MFVSEKQIEIRYAETDQMGVVYHANYIIWMEIGRTQLVSDAGFEYLCLRKRWLCIASDGFIDFV